MAKIIVKMSEIHISARFSLHLQPLFLRQWSYKVRWELWRIPSMTFQF